MKKALAVIGVIAALVAACVALVLTGVVKLPAEIAEQLPAVELPALKGDDPVEESLGSLTDTSKENVRARLGEPLCQSLEAASIEPREVFDAFYGRISYEIDESSLPADSDTASCKVTVTNVDVAQAVRNYNSAFTAWTNSDDFQKALAADTDTLMWEREVAMLASAFGDPNLEMKTYDLTAQLEKDENGNWRVVNEGEIYKAVCGGYTPESLL